jgi:UDP:flavonoid glycosyltransferase YjiC (YdhE family)
MRLLISAVPAAGHVFPLLPMATQAGREGHEVVVLSSEELRPLLGSVDVRIAGPSIWSQREETVRRLGRDWSGPGPESAEMFAGVRVQRTFEPALAEARHFAPDLIMCDPFDFVGPMLASALGVSWAAHGISGALPPPFQDALLRRWAIELDAHQLAVADRLAYLDPYPDLLRAPDEAVPADRMPVRVTPYDDPAVSYEPKPFSDPDLPTALLTLGTSISDTDAISQLALALAQADFNVIVTGASGLPDTNRIQAADFIPLARLLPTVDIVISAAGSGTLLSALAAGLPLVLRPFIADQPANAARAERLGVAQIITSNADAGRAARQVISQPTFRAAAERVSEQIGSYPSPSEVLQQLLARIG